MSYDTVEVANVAGGEAKYRVRATTGTGDPDTLEQEEHWADTVLLNGNEVSTGTSVGIGGAEAVLVSDEENTICIEL